MAWYRCGGGGSNENAGLNVEEVEIYTVAYRSSPLEEEQNGNS